MSDNWTKALRGGQTSTPRSKANNRYGAKVGSEDDTLDTAESAAKKTLRQTGLYDRPWKELAAVSSAGRATPRSRLHPKLPVSRLNSTVDDIDDASVAESDDISVATEDDYRDTQHEGDSVQVFVRVRPINTAEAAEGDHYNCTRLYGDRTVSVQLRHRPEPYQFKFDAVLSETTMQLEIFERAGKPIVDNCMGGYNSSIFAYGQTGAGKTYTMQGPLMAADQDCSEERGLAPRVFEYLFSEIEKAQDEKGHENLTFCCRCSMLEIYNEVITDLLNPSATNLQIREDIKRGCYVEDLSERLIQNVVDAMRLMRLGAENRHVGETRLNRESSRSHSVFTCTLERHSKSEETGVTNVLFSRLNLIDLAGSERIHGGEHGGSQATGKHFKEACHINKSLTTLGRVITELVDAQRGTSNRPFSTGLKTRHVPYRDSRLTFLLQDSLGGNAKTLMIANISPSSVSAQETLSTLHFMSRAKRIRNRATINLDARGDVVLLQREIVRLNIELDNLRKGYTEPAIQENKELRVKLEEMAAAKGQLEVLMLSLEKENQNFKAERRRLDLKMAQIQKGAGQLDQAIFSLTAKVMHHESLVTAATEKGLQAARAEHELEMLEMQQVLAHQSHENKQLDQKVAALQEQLQQERLAQQEAETRYAAEVHDIKTAAADQVAAAHQELQETRQHLQEEKEALHQQREALQQQLAQAEEQGTASQAQAHRHLEEAAASNATLQQQLDEAMEARVETQEALRIAKAVNAGVDEQVQQLMSKVAQVEAEVASTQHHLSDAQQQLADKEAQLALAQQHINLQTAQLTQVQQAAGQQVEDAVSKQQELAQQLQQSQDQLAEAQRQTMQCQQQLQELQVQHDQATAQVKKLSEQLAKLQQQLQDLEASSAASDSVNQQLQAQLATLDQQLSDAATAASATSAAHEAALQQSEQELQAERQQVADSQAQIASLENALSEVNATVKDKAHALVTAQQQCHTLQQQLEAAAAAATARTDQLGHDLAAARESSKSRQEELMKQVTEVHLQLSAAQQEQERLQDELDAARSDSGLLQGQLADAQALVEKLRGQITSKGLENDLLHKKLATADSTACSLKAELAEREQELDKVWQQLRATEASGHDEQQRAADKLNAMQRELLDAQELLTSRNFEAQQMQRRMQELSQRLTDKTSSLETLKEENKTLKAHMKKMEGTQRQQDAVLRERDAMAQQLQADNDVLHACNRELQNELNARENNYQGKLTASEFQLKQELVYNARNRRAMSEIKRVINWAQQSPTPVGHNRLQDHPNGSRSSRQQSIGQPQPSLLDAGLVMAETDQYDAGPSSKAYSGHGSSGSSSDTSHRQQHSSSSASSGGSSKHSSPGVQLAHSMSGPQGPRCAPLMLDHIVVGMPAGGHAANGHSRNSSSNHSRTASTSSAAPSGGIGRHKVGPGDGIVSVTFTPVASSRTTKHVSKSAQQSVYQQHSSSYSSNLRQSVEVGCVDDQDGVELYTDDGLDDVGSNSSRPLLVPERASSPLQLASHKADGRASPKHNIRGSRSRKGNRHGDKGATDRGFRLQSVQNQHSFSIGKRHDMLMSADPDIMLSVSAEWSGGTGPPDMQLPAAIVGDVEQSSRDV